MNKLIKELVNELQQELVVLKLQSMILEKRIDDILNLLREDNKEAVIEKVTPESDGWKPFNEKIKKLVNKQATKKPPFFPHKPTPCVPFPNTPYIPPIIYPNIVQCAACNTTYNINTPHNCFNKFTWNIS